MTRKLNTFHDLKGRDGVKRALYRDAYVNAISENRANSSSNNSEAEEEHRQLEAEEVPQLERITISR